MARDMPSWDASSSCFPLVEEKPRLQTAPPELKVMIAGAGAYASEVVEGIVMVPPRLLGKETRRPFKLAQTIWSKRLAFSKKTRFRSFGSPSVAIITCSI